MATSLGAFTETGTVTSHRDLLVKLNTFAVSLGWSSLRFDTVSSNHELILKSPNDAIVGFREIFNVNEDVYNLELQGFTNFDDSLSFHEQAGAIDYYNVNNVTARDRFASQISLSNQEMTYWFNLAHDKVLMIVKIGSIYVSSYSGLFKRAASPLQYPYPMFVGGNSYGGTTSNNISINMMRYSSNSTYNSNPIFGIGDSTSSSSSTQASNSRCRKWLMKPSGEWEQMAGTSSEYNNTAFTLGYGFYKGFSKVLVKDYENKYNIRQALICSKRLQNTNQSELLGEFYSQYLISGQGFLPEDQITIDDDNFILFPDVFRTSFSDFFVVKIE